MEDNSAVFILEWEKQEEEKKPLTCEVMSQALLQQFAQWSFMQTMAERFKGETQLNPLG